MLAKDAPLAEPKADRTHVDTKNKMISEIDCQIIKAHKNAELINLEREMLLEYITDMAKAFGKEKTASNKDREIAAKIRKDKDDQLYNPRDEKDKEIGDVREKCEQGTEQPRDWADSNRQGEK